MLAILLIFLAPVLARAALYGASKAPLSWADADWSSTGSLPRADADKDARLLVFTGTTGGWKGVVSVHSWVVFKRAGAARWTRYDVVGWGVPLRSNAWAPDGRWYGNTPQVIADVSGASAEKMIPKVEAAIANYDYRHAGDYKIWPGPNSNSFVAAVLRAVPELETTLPPNAIGRDYRDGFYAGRTDSRTGVEVNLGGYAGVKIGWVEGVEVNLLGLVAGFDVRRPAIKLPGFGRIGIDPGVAHAAAR
jgi:Protein of unknown function (DUF3750)